MLAAAILAATLAASPSGDLAPTRAKLLESIQCARQSSTPAGDGLGALWGCYAQGDAVKLWLTAEPGGERLASVKLSAFAIDGDRLHVSAKLWAAVLSREFALPASAAEALAACQAASGDGWATTCQRGPTGRQAELLIQ